MLSGSCAATMLHVWPELFPADSRAEQVLERVVEFGALLAPLAEPADRRVDARPTAYHCSCHMRRGLRDSDSGSRLLDALPGIERREAAEEDACCGFGGTFAVKFPGVSGAMGRDKARWTRESGAEMLVSGDLGCLLHIEGAASAAGAPLRALTVPELLDREGWTP